MRDVKIRPWCSRYIIIFSAGGMLARRDSSLLVFQEKKNLYYGF